MTEPRQIPADAEALRDWLRELKEQAGVSYADIARAIGEEERTVKRWMTGDTPSVPRGDALLRLLDFFGVVLEPAAPDQIARSISGELRALRNEIVHARDTARTASDKVSPTGIERRLQALEAKVDEAAQDVAEALARLAAGIDELLARLPGEAPGTQQKARRR